MAQKNLENRIILLDKYTHYGSTIEDGELILYQDIQEDGDLIRRYFKKEIISIHGYRTEAYKFYKEEKQRNP